MDTNQAVHLTLGQAKGVGAALFSSIRIDIWNLTKSSCTFSAQGLSWSSCGLQF